MYCPSLDSICIRANGSLSCWDDSGFQKTLIEYDRSLDYVKDVYWGAPFNSIRKKIANKEFPFPEFCRNCLSMQFNSIHKSLFKQPTEIRVMNIEPTITCHLNCSGCTSGYERKNNFKPPFFLDYSVFEKIMTDLSKHVKVHNVMFSGNGEPLKSEATWEMAKLAKRLYPETNTFVCTSGDVPFDPKFVLSNLTRLTVSLDGVDQDSYEKYRVNGNFSRAYDFMKNYTSACKNQHLPTKVMWKYILFDHNDSAKQLSKVMELAIQAHVDEVYFVITSKGPASEKIVNATEIKKIIRDFHYLRKIKYSFLPEKIYFAFQNGFYHLWYSPKMRVVLEKSSKLFQLAYTGISNLSQQSGDEQEKPLITSAAYYISDRANLKKALRQAKTNIAKNEIQKGLNRIAYTNNMISKLSKTKPNMSFKRKFKDRYSAFLSNERSA